MKSMMINYKLNTSLHLHGVPVKKSAMAKPPRLKSPVIKGSPDKNPGSKTPPVLPAKGTIRPKTPPVVPPKGVGRPKKPPVVPPQGVDRPKNPPVVPPQGGGAGTSTAGQKFDRVLSTINTATGVFALVHPLNSVFNANGTFTYPDGSIADPAKNTVTSPQGTVQTLDADGNTHNPDGSIIYQNGTIGYADGSYLYTDGTRLTADKTVIYPDGTTGTLE